MLMRLGLRGAQLLAAVLVLDGLFAFAVVADTLRRGTTSDPNSLDPHVASGNASAILHDLHIGLVTFDAAGRLIPGAADSWQVSADGLVYTFALRPRLQWSDGSPLTAEDFVFSMRRLLSPATGARFGPFFFAIRNARSILRGHRPPEDLGVSAPDSRTIVFELAYPSGGLLQNLASFGGAPVPRTVIDQHGSGWARPGRMISAGAFRLVEWVPQSHLLLEKNPHFFDAERVQLDQVLYYPTSSVETAFRRYRAGELDVLLRFPADKLDWIEENLPGQLRISPALGLSYLLVNHDLPTLADARVRRALSLSIDRRALLEQVVRAGFLPAYTVTPGAVSGYEEPVPAYARQPMTARLAEARRLLAEAGFGPSRPLRFELQYMPLEESRRIIVALQAMWQALGVELAPRSTDLSTLNKAVRTGSYQVSRYAWFSPNDDPETFLYLLESGNPNNHSGYRNPEYDRLVREASRTLEENARLDRFRQAEQIALEEQAIIPVFFFVHRSLVSPAVNGFIANQRGITPSRFMRLER